MAVRTIFNGICQLHRPRTPHESPSDFFHQLGRKPVPANLQALQNGQDGVDKATFPRRQKDTRYADNGYTSAFGNGPAFSFVNQEEPTFYFLGQEPGLGLARIKNEHQLGTGGNGRCSNFQPALGDGLRTMRRGGSSRIQAELMLNRRGNQYLFV
jgi:hypothetical protein